MVKVTPGSTAAKAGAAKKPDQPGSKPQPKPGADQEVICIDID